MSNTILPQNYNLGIVPEPFVPGTIKPEKDYKEFDRLGAKLGLPCPQVHVGLVSVDADGNVVDEYHDRSRTFNRNFWNFIFRDVGCQHGNPNTSQQGTDTFPLSSTTFAAGHLTLKNVAGTIINSNFSSGPNSLTATSAVGTSLSGIRVGTGTAAEDFEGFNLATPINHGTGAGQMTYNAEAIPTPTYNAGTKVWTAAHQRIFNNNSGGTITVTETGMFMYNSSSGAGSIMVMRDLLGASVSVLNAGQLTVTYTFTLTFPA